MSVSSRLLPCLAASLLMVSGCSSGDKVAQGSSAVQAPNPTSAAVATTAPPAPQSVNLPKGDVDFYGGTWYTGCGHYLNATEVKAPQVFDTATGQVVTVAMPKLDAGENLNRSACALTGTAPDLRLVYVYDTTKPAGGLNPRVDKKTAYVFDLHSAAPLATADVTDLNYFQVGGTSTGAVLSGPELHAPGGATEVLSNKDLSVLWTDPDPVNQFDDSVIAIRRVDTRGFFTVELRAPSGESLYKTELEPGIDVRTVSDGVDHLVQLAIQKQPGVKVDSFFDVKSRTILNINGSPEVPDPTYGDWDASVFDGRLFLDGQQSGLLLWNLRTQQAEFQKSAEELKSLDVNRVYYYGGYLYIATNGGNPPLSVYKLPDTVKPVATQWKTRPTQRLNGWTLVCQGEVQGNGLGKCLEQVVIKDQNGGFPGPWF